MAQKGRSARETQEELELYRDKLARKKRRLEMVRGFLKPLLFLASGLIIGVVAFALLSSFTEERGGRAEPPPDIEATVQSRVEKALASMPKPTPEVVVKEVIVEKAAGVVSDSESVLAEDVFQDIFQNATRVDKVSIDDVKNCRVLSEYEVQLGDTVSVEVGLARKEDSRSRAFGFQPYFTRLWDKHDGVLGNHVEATSTRVRLERTISNQWNEMNTGPYVVAVYRGGSMAHDPFDAGYVIGERNPHAGTLLPGIYRLSFADADVAFSSTRPCSDMLKSIDVTNLIPDSVLIAWYVN